MYAARYTSISNVKRRKRRTVDFVLLTLFGTENFAVLDKSANFAAFKIQRKLRDALPYIREGVFYARRIFVH